MSQIKHSVSVAAVITDSDGCVLVVERRDNGKWEIPGGILEVEESIPAGLCREVLEETGFVIEPERLTGVYKNMRLGVVALVFRATVTGGQRTLSDETTNINWWTRDQVATRMAETFAVRVLDALDSTTVTVRQHDGVHVLDEQRQSVG